MQHVVFQLMEQTWSVMFLQVSVCKGSGFVRVIRNADVKSLAATYDVNKSLHGFLERSVRIEAVRIEDVHIVGIHALETLVEAGNQILA